MAGLIVRECIDALHLMVEAGRRTAEHSAPFAEAMRIWDSAFRAADTFACMDELAGAMRVILESCRTLTDALSATLAIVP